MLICQRWLNKVTYFYCIWIRLKAVARQRSDINTRSQSKSNIIFYSLGDWFLCTVYISLWHKLNFYWDFFNSKKSLFQAIWCLCGRAVNFWALQPHSGPPLNFVTFICFIPGCVWTWSPQEEPGLLHIQRLSRSQAGDEVHRLCSVCEPYQHQASNPRTWLKSSEKRQPGERSLNYES